MKIGLYSTVAPAQGDIVIGTDANDSSATKNFEVSAIANMNRNKGSFFHVVSQTAAAINTAYAARFGTTSPNVSGLGFTVANDGSGNPTQITAGAGVSGYFSVNFYAQALKSTAGSATVDVWLRVGGTDVANSTKTFTSRGSGDYTAISCDYLIPIGALEYVQIMWATSDTGVSLAYVSSSGTHPAGPSSSITVYQV